MKIVIEITKNEIKKLENLTDKKILDDNEFVSDEIISDAINILLKNL